MKKYKISLILNIIVFILVLLGTVFMVTGFRFMGDDIILAESKINAFKYFTVDSNILMGIAALLFAYYELLIILKKKKEIPKSIYAFKHIATVGVALTFVVTVLYLAPFSEYRFLDFFKNSNLFFHLFVPVLSVVSFLFYENNNKQNKNVILLGMIPMTIYSIFYVTGYILHIGNDTINDYDWYHLVRNGILESMISIFSMFLLTYLISYGLWYFNKKIVK